MIVTITNTTGVRLTFETVPLGAREREAYGQRLLKTAPPTTSAKERRKIKNMRTYGSAEDEGWDD